MAAKKKKVEKKELTEGEIHEAAARADFDACVKAQAKADKECK